MCGYLFYSCILVVCGQRCCFTHGYLFTRYTAVYVPTRTIYIASAFVRHYVTHTRSCGRLHTHDSFYAFYDLRSTRWSRFPFCCVYAHSCARSGTYSLPRGSHSLRAFVAHSCVPTYADSCAPHRRLRTHSSAFAASFAGSFHCARKFIDRAGSTWFFVLHTRLLPRTTAPHTSATAVVYRIRLPPHDLRLHTLRAFHYSGHLLCAPLFCRITVPRSTARTLFYAYAHWSGCCAASTNTVAFVFVFGPFAGFAPGLRHCTTALSHLQSLPLTLHIWTLRFLFLDTRLICTHAYASVLWIVADRMVTRFAHTATHRLCTLSAAGRARLLPRTTRCAPFTSRAAHRTLAPSFVVGISCCTFYCCSPRASCFGSFAICASSFTASLSLPFGPRSYLWIGCHAFCRCAAFASLRLRLVYSYMRCTCRCLRVYTVCAFFRRLPRISFAHITHIILAAHTTVPHMGSFRISFLQRRSRTALRTVCRALFPRGFSVFTHMDHAHLAFDFCVFSVWMDVLLVCGFRLRFWTHTFSDVLASLFRCRSFRSRALVRAFRAAPLRISFHVYCTRSWLPFTGFTLHSPARLHTIVLRTRFRLHDPAFTLRYVTSHVLAAFAFAAGSLRSVLPDRGCTASLPLLSLVHFFFFFFFFFFLFFF